MKSNSKRCHRSFGLKRARTLTVALGLILMAGIGVLVLVGCQNSIPALGVYGAPASQVNRDLVADFSLGNLGANVPLNQTTQGPVTTTAGARVEAYPINSNLFEMSNPPSYTLKTPGAVTVLNNFPAYCTLLSWGLYGPGANGAAYGYRMFGQVTDLGDGSFPELDMTAYIENEAFYDALNFTGVQFYLKIASDDTTLQRHFAIPVYQTIAVSGGGGCTSGPHLCYDHFAADVTGGTNGQWQFFRYNFSDLKQLVAGAIPDPPTLSGANLEQIMWLQWGASRNNKAGTSTVDIWVDDIELFK
jgi:hypothetical protein